MASDDRGKQQIAAGIRLYLRRPDPSNHPNP